MGDHPHRDERRSHNGHFLLFFSLKAPDMGVTVQWAIRIFAIAACAVQFIVFILFARAFKKNRKY